MKIKYSLVALFALSNISFVNAQSLENAIKNVETSGTVAYRYNDYEASTNTGMEQEHTQLEIKINL